MGEYWCTGDIKGGLDYSSHGGMSFLSSLLGWGYLRPCLRVLRFFPCLINDFVGFSVCRAFCFRAIQGLSFNPTRHYPEKLGPRDCYSTFRGRLGSASLRHGDPISIEPLQILC